jgi:hypothetical protein
VDGALGAQYRSTGKQLTRSLDVLCDFTSAAGVLLRDATEGRQATRRPERVPERQHDSSQARCAWRVRRDALLTLPKWRPASEVSKASRRTPELSGDLGLWVTPHAGIDLITFARSVKSGKRTLESAAGPLEPVTLEASGKNSGAVASGDPQNVSIFGNITILPVSWKPGRHGLARTLFEILSFRPVRMRTQVLVWSLVRKATYTFPPSKLEWEAPSSQSDLRERRDGRQIPRALLDE